MELKNKIQINYHTDPSHGWLVISRSDAEDILGDTLAKISPCSYDLGDYIALEHDDDAVLFVTACKEQGIEYEVTETTSDGPSPIATFPPFTTTAAAHPPAATQTTNTPIPSGPSPGHGPVSSGPVGAGATGPSSGTDDAVQEGPPPAGQDPEPAAPADPPADPPVARLESASEPALEPVAPRAGSFILPSLPLWAAAQIASTDETKGVLNGVHIACDGKTVTLNASNNYMLLQASFPMASWMSCSDELLMDAAPLRKMPAKTERISYNNETNIGSYRNRLGKAVGAFEASWEWLKLSAIPPNYSQYIPDSFRCDSVPLVFGPSLMGTICKVAEKTNGRIQMQWNNGGSPIGLTWLAHDPTLKDPYQIKVLLMPIHVKQHLNWD